MLVKDFINLASFGTRYKVIEKKGLKQVTSGIAYTTGLKVRKNFADIGDRKICYFSVYKDCVSLIIV